MDLSRILFDENNLLRSGWRFAVFLLAFVFSAIVLGILTFGLLTSMGIATNDGSATNLTTNAVMSLIPAVIIGWLCGKHLEQLPFRALGAWFTNLWLRHFVVGCIIGGLTVGASILTAAAFGGLRFSVNTASTATIIRSAAVSFGIFAIAAAFEEALFRGYILQTFARSGLAPFAIAMTSVFFGAVHATNPNVGKIAIGNTMLAGVWFGVAYLKTRDLWFVWGLHLIWNWMQGSIFGIEVSGLTDITKASLLTEIDTGPVWLTGGDYGIEGGIGCTVALVLSTIAIQFLPILKPDPEMLALTSPNAQKALSELA